MTQEELEALQAQQAQGQQQEPQGQQQEPQGMDAQQQAIMQQQMQQQQMQQQQMQQGEPSDDELELAKKALGLDKIMPQLAEVQKTLQEQQARATVASIAAETKGVSVKDIDTELAEIEKTDPNLAQQMRGNPTALKILAQKIQAQIAPSAKPDNITDSGDNGGVGTQEDIEKRLKEGKGSDLDLGNYILGLSK